MRSTLVPIIPLLRFSLVSRAREFPNPHLDLGKAVEEAGYGKILNERMSQHRYRIQTNRE